MTNKLIFALLVSGLLGLNGFLAPESLAADKKAGAYGKGTGDCMQANKDARDDCLKNQMQHRDDMKQGHDDMKDTAKDKMKDKAKDKDKMKQGHDDMKDKAKDKMKDKMKKKDK